MSASASLCDTRKRVSYKPSRMNSISEFVGPIPSQHASFVEIRQRKSRPSFVYDDQKSISSLPSMSPSKMFSDPITKTAVELRELTAEENEFFASLDDEELEAVVGEVKREYRTLSVENQLFEDFLYINEPALLSNYEGVQARINELSKVQPLAVLDFKEGIVKSDLYSKNRINLSQRMDLIMRKSEEMVDSLQNFIKKAKMEKFMLLAETEACGIKVKDYENSRQTFELEVVTKGVDPITQKIPAEKFFRYMSEWQKNAIVMTEKLRLGNMSLKQELTRLIQLYRQKVYIGESVQEIDFEQVIIANRGMRHKLEEQSTAVVSTKHMCGDINLRKAKAQSYLMKIMRGLTLLRKEKDLRVQSTESMTAMALVTQKELDKAKRQYEAVTNMIERHKVPSVLDYVRVKATLDGHKKNIKILNRRTNLINIVLDTTKKLLKNAPKMSMKELQALDDDDISQLTDSQSYTNLDEPLPFDIYEVLHNANA